MMRYFLQTKGFFALLIILFIGSFIELGHKIIILNSIYQVFEGNLRFLLAILQNILIFLPAILLFYPSGIITDTRNLKKNIQISSWISLGLSISLLLCYSFGAFWSSFILSFLLATQSIFFFPSKLTYLKHLFSSCDLMRSYSITQATIIGSMLLSFILFGSIFKLFSLDTHNSSDTIQSIKSIGFLFIIASLIQIIASYKLPNFENQKPQTTNPFVHFKEILANPNLYNPIFGNTLFWMLAQFCIIIFPYHTQTQSVEYLVFSAIALGAGGILGSIFAFSLAKKYLELGLVPFGLLGITLCLGLFAFSPSIFGSTLLAFFFGLSGTLILIPFFSLLLRESKALGQTLSFYLFFQSVGSIFSICIVFFFIFLELDASFAFGVWFWIAIGGSVFCIANQPFILVRFLLTFAFNQRYRLIVEGLAHIPQNRGVLLIGNHMSFIDWAIVQMAIPQRVYFAIEHNLHSKWFIKFFLNHFVIIPHTSTIDLIHAMNSLLSQNQIVCFFPEGAVSTHGHLNEFKKDFSHALNEDSLIVPFYIRGLWGTSFSRSNENFKARNHSLLNKRNITIAFGEALPPQTPKEKVKNNIFDLSFVAWKSQCQTMPTLGRAWINIAKTHLFQTSIIDPISGSFSFGKVLALSLLLSQKLRKTSSITPQGEFAPSKECIGILLPASFASSLCNLSILLASKVSVNLNFTSGSNSLNLAIQSASIKRILTSQTFLEKLKDKGITLEFYGVEMLYMEDLVKEFQAQKIKLIGYLAMAFLLPSALLKSIFSPEKNTQEIACILFSSGSEDIPKGIMLNHNNIMSNIAQISDVLCVQDDDAILSSLPPFHAFGLTATTFLPLLSGVPSITYADPTDAQGVAQTIAKHQATIMCGTSTFLGIYTRHPKVDRLMFSSLRIIVSGAEKLKSETRTAFENKFQHVILEGYGATETTPVVSVNLPCKFDTENEEIHQANKIGSVGMPLPGTTLKIVNPESMEELPHRHEGLVLVGGHQVMVGYLNNPMKTQEVIIESNGMRWYKTGDKGYLDEDGFLYIIDRYSRFAKIGGEMVSLGSIEEEVIKIIGKIEELQECKCLAVALEDSKKGEMIVLLLQAQTDEAYSKLIEEIKHSTLPPISKPKYYFRVNSIPLLGSGKADLKGAKDLANSLLKESQQNT